ncbi:hypothetical protein BT96DRAFT_1071851 [Gymnopus androsaceus JB14]|uniref:Protein kinase domain-containing protein n=1 Tax=Gymnopus androsaceus JB14 TaxID=1447944 RepID=A0A6A4GU38_9AGAR|nr:hypothetical protein BT96DRAFT_1071851 [Gymnopus androsaceus JB14]
MNPAHTASVQGSLRWLAPEFINPTPMPIQGRLTSRDIYAFGCTMFEILTGQPPFSHLNLDISVAIDVLKGVRPVLPSIVIPKEDVFKAIRVMLDSCWAEEIKHRLDARDVLDFLKHVHNFLRYSEQKLGLFSLFPVLNAAEKAPKTSDKKKSLFGHNHASSIQQLSGNCGSNALNPLTTVIDSGTSANGETFTGLSFRHYGCDGL